MIAILKILSLSAFAGSKDLFGKKLHQKRSEIPASRTMIQTEKPSLSKRSMELICMSALDIHEYHKRYESAIRRIRASDIPEANKEAILGFQKDLTA